MHPRTPFAMTSFVSLFISWQRGGDTTRHTAHETRVPFIVYGTSLAHCVCWLGLAWPWHGMSHRYVRPISAGIRRSMYLILSATQKETAIERAPNNEQFPRGVIYGLNARRGCRDFWAGGSIVCCPVCIRYRCVRLSQHD